MSDYRGARLIVDVLPPAKQLLADRGYDADWFREALQAKDIEPCIPPRKNRKQKIEYDADLYKQRHKVENMFGKLKDWRRIATRYDRCAHTFFSAICIAASVLFYLNQCVLSLGARSASVVGKLKLWSSTARNNRSRGQAKNSGNGIPAKRNTT